MPSNQKPTVCRCLFGKPDHESVRESLDKELKSQRLSSKSAWNFDFDTETPLAGRYQWVVLSDSDYTPEFYRKFVEPKRLELKNNNSPKPADVPDCQEVKKLPRTTDSKRRSITPRKLVQAHMEVFMKQRKRRRDSDLMLSPTRTPKSLRQDLSLVVGYGEAMRCIVTRHIDTELACSCKFELASRYHGTGTHHRTSIGNQVCSCPGYKRTDKISLHLVSKDYCQESIVLPLKMIHWSGL
ncbi:hypothetical protein ScPMuIL_000669 [Solemya velum]